MTDPNLTVTITSPQGETVVLPVPPMFVNCVLHDCRFVEGLEGTIARVSAKMDDAIRRAAAAHATNTSPV